MSKLVTFLSAATGLNAYDVRGIITRAPISYKFYSIPKRSGGERLISQPAREVKVLQAALVRRLRHLQIHDAATAYRTGQSIRLNAERHAGNGPIKKYDFKDFFHSIRDVDWMNYCDENSVFSVHEDIELSARLFFHKVRGSSGLRLAMGAPSSPWLSNVLMYAFDERISSALVKDKITYTRYADDLTFSAPRTGHLTVVDRALRQTLKAIEYPKLRLNEEKTVLSTTKYRRFVTGLVLANDGRVTIGRERKREIRAALHRFEVGKNNIEDNMRLAGLLAFINDVEPSYMRQIREKYGEDIMSIISGLVQGNEDSYLD